MNSTNNDTSWRQLTKKFEGVLNAKDSNGYSGPAVRTALVERQDEEGTWWISILGGSSQTPLNSPPGVSLNKGDYIRVEIDDGICRVIDNPDSPAVDSVNAENISKTAIEESVKDGDVHEAIETMANQSIIKSTSQSNKAISNIVKALGEATGISYNAETSLSSNVQRTKDGFKSMYASLKAINQHFWSDTTGIHISEGKKDPIADYNYFANSRGMFLRNNEKIRIGIVEDGVFIGLGTLDSEGNWVPEENYGYSSYTAGGMTVFNSDNDALGTFAGDSAVIGKINDYHVDIGTTEDSAGIILKYDDTELGSFTENGVLFSGSYPVSIGNNDAYVIFTPGYDGGEGTVAIGGNVIMGSSKTLDEILYDVENTLVLDTTTSYDSQNETVTIEAHLYRGGVDVRSEYESNDFTWGIKRETDVVPVPLDPGYGYSCTVDWEEAGFGATVVCTFSPANNAELLNDEDDTLTNEEDIPFTVRTPSGDYVRVSDLTVTTILYDSDRVMIVGQDGEKLATIGTLKEVFGDGDYERLDNRPSIENVELIGNKTFPDLGIFKTDSQGYSVADDYTLTAMDINSLWANAQPIGG